MTIIRSIFFTILILLYTSCDQKKDQDEVDVTVYLNPEEVARQNAIYEARKRAEEEAIIKDKQEEKIREANAKWRRRYCMTENELRAFLLVKKYTFNAIMRRSGDESSARARAEIGTARAFGLEPANWAKRDMVIYVEKEKQFKAERDEVERRLKAAHENSRKVEIEHMNDEDWNPLKDASLYWSQEKRNKEPDNPLSIAYQEEHKVLYEREQIYHKYGKETPEEKLGGAIAIILTMGMLGFEAAPAAGARAALSNLGRARSALALGESEVAFVSMGRARSILVSAGSENTALVSIRAAEKALSAGNVGKAMASIEEAQLILSPSWGIAPEGMLAVMAGNEIAEQLQSLEEADRELGTNERIKIEKFNYFESVQDEDIRVLDNDVKAANKFLHDYRELIAKGEIVQIPEGDRPLRRDCETGYVNHHNFDEVSSTPETSTSTILNYPNDISNINDYWTYLKRALYNQDVALLSVLAEMPLRYNISSAPEFDNAKEFFNKTQIASFDFNNRIPQQIDNPGEWARFGWKDLNAGEKVYFVELYRRTGSNKIYDGSIYYTGVNIFLYIIYSNGRFTLFCYEGPINTVE